MAVSQGKGNGPEEQEDLSQIKRKLAWRMGVAGVMIIGLLGGLWLFDSMMTSKSPSESPPPQFTEPVPVAKKTITQPLTAVEPGADSKEELKGATPELTAAPADRASPTAALAPTPEMAAQPSSVRPGKQPVRPPSSAPLSTAPARPSEVKRDAAAVVAPSTDLSGAGPLTASVPQRQPQVLPRLFSGVSLQAGVFADPRRAEELHARLLQEGIPSTLETRVVVGPFRSQEEADAARTKMRAMGIDSVQLPKARKK